MELNITLTDEEIKEAVLAIVAKRTAEDLDLETYSSLKYVTRKEVKAVIRDLLKEHMDELADRAVSAAAKSIENRAVKKLLDRISEE